MSLARINQKTKSFSELNLQAAFNNDTVSSNCTFTYMETFKELIGFQNLIGKTITYQKPANSTFPTPEVLDYMIDANIQGYFRFHHLMILEKTLAIPKSKIQIFQVKKCAETC